MICGRSRSGTGNWCGARTRRRWRSGGWLPRALSVVNASLMVVIRFGRDGGTLAVTSPSAGAALGFDSPALTTRPSPNGLTAMGAQMDELEAIVQACEETDEELLQYESEEGIKP